MPRPRQDQTPPAAPHRHKLNDQFVKRLRPQARKYLVWDTHQRGLAVIVLPTGYKAWKCIYSLQGRPRWYSIGDAAAIGLADARRLAARVMYAVAEGKDPAADRRASRSRGTFEELAVLYVEQHAKRNNKSWRQADALVKRHLIPPWGKLQAGAVTRTDVKAMMARIAAPIVANQTLAAASAIFSWAVKQDLLPVNACRGVGRNQTRSRERVLSASELPLFWNAFDDAGLMAGTALKLVLLTGQRPGEVAHMRTEHIVDGWWEMPGAPVPALRWPGTKNGQTHRVWLPAPAQKLLADLDASGRMFTGVSDLAPAMRAICAQLKVERATPHDLRRTHGSMVTALGFGRDAMNRIQNHREGGIASVYDRYQYADENRTIMEAVAARIMALVEGKPADNVITGGFRKKI
jgi:integrase